MSDETKPADTTAIAKRPIEMASGGLVLQDINDLWRFGQYVIASGMAPKGYAKPEQVVVAVQRGAEVGLKPLQALESIAVINGRATLWGDAIPALLDGSGLLEDSDEYLEGEGDRLTAVCRLKRRGRETPILRTFSVADAKAAGLWGKTGPWSQYPKRMLAMRARSWAARDGFADVLRGLRVREEVQDYHVEAPQPRRSVTLTADGRIEPTEPPALPGPVVVDETVEADVEAVAARELF